MNEREVYGTIKEDKFQDYTKKPVTIQAYKTEEELEIETLEGVMKANKGDYIIKGVEGELYPCKPDIFAKTYTKTNDTISYNDKSKIDFILDHDDKLLNLTLEIEGDTDTLPFDITPSELIDFREIVNELLEKRFPLDLHKDFTEYEELITNMNEDARELIKKETEYAEKSDALLKIAAHIKEENGDDIIKQKYGGNNDKTRKKYVEDELKEFADDIQELKFKKGEYNRRLGFLKRLIDMKISLIKYGED